LIKKDLICKGDRKSNWKEEGKQGKSPLRDDLRKLRRKDLLTGQAAMLESVPGRDLSTNPQK
jgi:hypothetical protein